MAKELEVYSALLQICEVPQTSWANKHKRGGSLRITTSGIAVISGIRSADRALRFVVCLRTRFRIVYISLKSETWTTTRGEISTCLSMGFFRVTRDHLRATCADKFSQDNIVQMNGDKEADCRDSWGKSHLET